MVSRSFSQPPDQQIEERQLPLEQLVARRREAEPFGPVDFRKAAPPTALGRPLDLEAVAADRRAVDIAFARIGDDPLAARLNLLAEQMQRALEGHAELLGEFATRRFFGLLPRHDLALGDRPRTQVPLHPERPTGMHEEN